MITSASAIGSQKRCSRRCADDGQQCRQTRPRVFADNQALTVLCEYVATVPTTIFPRVNAARAPQLARNDHLDRLRSVGVDLIYGDQGGRAPSPAPPAPGVARAAILSAIKPFG